MHEQSIVASLLSLALEDAKTNNARRIISIKLVVGELTGIGRGCRKILFRFYGEGYHSERCHP